MEMFLRIIITTLTYASYGISISSSAGPVEILQRVLPGKQQYSVINGGFPYIVEVYQARPMLIGTTNCIIKPFDYDISPNLSWFASAVGVSPYPVEMCEIFFMEFHSVLFSSIRITS